MAVVDRFEVVEVAHDCADRVPLATSADKLSAQRFIEVAPIVQAGERVTYGLIAEQISELR